MTAASFCRTVSLFFEFLAENGFAMALQAHRITPLSGGKSQVSWVEQLNYHSSDKMYLRTNDLILTEYLRCLRNRDFSVLLNDGGLIQVSVVFLGSEIESYRLCYIPCPIEFHESELLIGDDFYPLEDFICELGAEELRSRICLRPSFRFELDPDNARDDHPHSHVHFGRSDARIPVSSALCWDHFARFIFSRFYPTIFSVVQPLLRFPVSYRTRTITAGQEREVHIAFVT